MEGGLAENQAEAAEDAEEEKVLKEHSDERLLAYVSMLRRNAEKVMRGLNTTFDLPLKQTLFVQVHPSTRPSLRLSAWQRCGTARPAFTSHSPHLT